MKYAFIQRQSIHYPVTMLCRVIGVKRSPYYDWKIRGGKVIGPEELVLRRCMKALFAESRQSLGSRRMSKKLAEEGFVIGRYRARRLMKAMGLVVKARYYVSLDPGGLVLSGSGDRPLFSPGSGLVDGSANDENTGGPGLNHGN